jgi:hypothetical protein
VKPVSVPPYVWTKVPGTGLEVYLYADQHWYASEDDGNLVLHGGTGVSWVVRPEVQ